MEMASPYRCDMNAIDPGQRKQHVATITALFGAVQEIRELPNGYALRLPNDTSVLVKAVEFITLEKLCCPFFGFGLEVEPEGGPVWLRLTGAAGIKPFIEAEIGRALRNPIHLPKGV